jgi:hypothetical protein
MGVVMMRWLRRFVMCVGSLAMVAACLAAVGPAAAAQRSPKIWSPFPVPPPKSVPVHPIARGGQHHLRVHEAAGLPSRPYHPAVSWPAAGSALVSLAAAARVRSPHIAQPFGAVNSVTGRAGSLPVWVSGQAANADVAVSVASHRAALSAGVDGVVLGVAGRAAAPVSVRLDYSGFSGEFGGDWASRLRLTEMPACALTTPARAACRKQTPVRSVNDAGSQSLSANVRLGTGQTILAATASTGGGQGNYTATALKQSGTWAVQQGDFSYSYPITVPPALGGSAPSSASPGQPSARWGRPRICRPHTVLP